MTPGPASGAPPVGRRLALVCALAAVVVLALVGWVTATGRGGAGGRLVAVQVLGGLAVAGPAGAAWLAARPGRPRELVLQVSPGDHGPTLRVLPSARPVGRRRVAALAVGSVVPVLLAFAVGGAPEDVTAAPDVAAPPDVAASPDVSATRSVEPPATASAPTTVPPATAPTVPAPTDPAAPPPTDPPAPPPTEPPAPTDPPGLDQACPAGGAAQEYVIAPGDSLWALALRSRPTAPMAEVEAQLGILVELNAARVGRDPGLVRPGQRVLLCP